jgi:hypothetical protein
MAKIKSKSDLFPGKLVKKPKRAKVIHDAEGNALYVCPYCGHTDDADGCDIMGAEPGCMFCLKCSGEFQAW